MLHLFEILFVEMHLYFSSRHVTVRLRYLLSPIGQLHLHYENCEPPFISSSSMQNSLRTQEAFIQLRFSFRFNYTFQTCSVSSTNSTDKILVM